MKIAKKKMGREEGTVAWKVDTKNITELDNEPLSTSEVYELNQNIYVELETLTEDWIVILTFSSAQNICKSNLEKTIPNVFMQGYHGQSSSNQSTKINKRLKRETIKYACHK